MDKAQVEQGGGFLRRLVKRDSSREIAKSTTDFEQELFKNGTYRFNFDVEIKKSESEYHKRQSRLRRAQLPKEQSSLRDFVGKEGHELAWKQFFDGMVPKSWGESWTNVDNAFEEAGRRDVQLSEVLVNAGVSHYHPLVINRAGKNQRLTSDQLGLVLARGDIPRWNLKEVIKAQFVDRGMSVQEIREAEGIALEMRKKEEEVEQDKI